MLNTLRFIGIYGFLRNLRRSLQWALRLQWDTNLFLLTLTLFFTKLIIIWLYFYKISRFVFFFFFLFYSKSASISSLEEGLSLLAPLLGGVLRSGGSRYERSSIASTLSGKSCNNRMLQDWINLSNSSIFINPYFNADLFNSELYENSENYKKSIKKEKIMKKEILPLIISIIFFK